MSYFAYKKKKKNNQGSGGGNCLIGTEIRICKIKKFWISVSQQCEYSGHSWTAHFLKSQTRYCI